VRVVLYLVFLLSGAAGLTYESVWSRYLGIFVGHTAYAQVLVMGIFLGGMALGAHIVSRRTDRIADPLVAYALIEGLVGLMALFFHEMFLGVSGFAYDVVFPAVGSGALLTIIKWAMAGALLLPQSILLGATFPLMAAGVIRRVGGHPGRELAMLYFANGLGAAGGVLLAGFYLVPATGLPGAVLAAGITNLVVALVTFVVAKRVAVESTAASETAKPAQTVQAVPLQAIAPGFTRVTLTRFLLAVSFGTAFASFFYEIAWLRMLSLVLGSATHSFELMLSAFILGLAVGALWVRRRADLFEQPLRALGIVQWLMGFTAATTLLLYGQSFEWTATLVATFAQTDAGYQGFNLARYGINLVIMLPSTFCAGITLPLITRILMVHGNGEKAIGEVYSINTLGSIVGVGLAALVVLPLLGVRAVLLGGAVVDMLLGALLFKAAASRMRAVRLDVVAVAATGAVLVFLIPWGSVSQQYLVSGVFRHGRLVREQPFEIFYYGDGRTATAAVYKEPISRLITLSTNGKPDGSVHESWLRECTVGEVRELAGDHATQTLAPLITLAHAPNARRAAVIGHGTGMSATALLGDSRLEYVTSIEIEPEVIEASRQFLPANAPVFDDPRSEMIIADAKTHFATVREPYDIVFSEPSNPWVSGVASLFTVEFYQHVKRYLAADGVLGQWIHMYELDDGLLLSVLAAIHEAFPSYALYTTNDVDLLIVASPSELASPDWGRVSDAVAAGGLLCDAPPLRTVDLAALFLADRPAFAPFLDMWGYPNSDFYPVLDMGAERTRFLRGSASGFVMLRYEGFNIPAAVGQHRFGALPDPSIGVQGVHRLQLLRIAASIRAGIASDDSTVSDPAVAEALARYRNWERQLAGTDDDVDWTFWINDFRQAERDRDGGMDGVVDTEFFESVYAFVDAREHPALLRSAIDFHYGLASWDFDLAGRAADDLAATGEGAKWIGADLLVEGGVTAKLLTGDVDGARRLYQALLDAYERDPEHLRRRLLEAYLQQGVNVPKRED